jgi:hypothetical protein
MSDPPTDEPRLRVAEEQMRRALGLRESSASAPQNAPPAAPPGAPHPYRRRFVRDGEVPVTLVHHDHADGSGINKIAAARQALHEQVTARERAEHLLQEARTTIQTLETKLAHERIGKDEALRRLEDELSAERTARQQAVQERDVAVAARQNAEERLREVMAVLQEAQRPSSGSVLAKWAGKAGRAGATDRHPDRPSEVSDTVPPNDAGPVTQTRRRGRPPKASQPEGRFVEWWKPNWRERLR